MTEKQQTYNTNTKSNITRIDDDTVEIYYQDINFTLSKEKINIVISQEHEWLNLLYEACRMLLCNENLHSEKCSTSITPTPTFDNYNTT